MNKFIKIKLPKKQLAYTLSAALLISFMPNVSFAAELNNTETPAIITESPADITANAVTGSTIIPGNSQTGASTGGAIDTGTQQPAETPPVNGSSQPDTITGGAITPAPGSSSTPDIIIPIPGGSQIWTPDNTTAPDASQTTAPSATPPVTGTSQPDTVTGGAVSPGTSTGGAITPGNSQTPSPAPLAVGTKFTAGNYIYRVTGSNTVALKGFAKGVSLSTVTAQNQVTYNKTKYNVTKIGDNAFKGQTCIKTVLIRKNITDISLKAFYNCKNITKVTIRTGVKIIRKQAFMGCKKLKTINITSTVLSQVKNNAFKNIKNGAVINVVNKQAKLAVKASIPASVKVNQM